MDDLLPTLRALLEAEHKNNSTWSLKPFTHGGGVRGGWACKKLAKTAGTPEVWNAVYALLSDRGVLHVKSSEWTKVDIPKLEALIESIEHTEQAEPEDDLVKDVFHSDVIDRTCGKCPLAVFGPTGFNGQYWCGALRKEEQKILHLASEPCSFTKAYDPVDVLRDRSRLIAAWHPRRLLVAVCIGLGSIQVLEWHPESSYLEVVQEIKSKSSFIKDLWWTRDGVVCWRALNGEFEQHSRVDDSDEPVPPSYVSHDGRWRVVTRNVGSPLVVSWMTGQVDAGAKDSTH